MSALDNARGALAEQIEFPDSPVRLHRHGGYVQGMSAYECALHDALRDLIAEHERVTAPPTDDEMRRLSEAARPGPWRAYETMQADNFIVEESQGLLTGPGPIMGPSYDKSTTEYVVALVNAHRAALDASEAVR